MGGMFAMEDDENDPEYNSVEFSDESPELSEAADGDGSFFKHRKATRGSKSIDSDID